MSLVKELYIYIPRMEVDGRSGWWVWCFDRTVEWKPNGDVCLSISVVVWFVVWIVCQL